MSTTPEPTSDRPKRCGVCGMVYGHRQDCPQFPSTPNRWEREPLDAEQSEREAIASFYAEHYSDWTVHEFSLSVHAPMRYGSRREALDLVREILDESDIKVEDRSPRPAVEDPRIDAIRAYAEGEGWEHADALLDIVGRSPRPATEDVCTCECSPPEFGGNLPDRACPIHASRPATVSERKS